MKNVRVLIDAEQTYYQPAIRSLVVHYLMKTYNKNQPIFYNTLQSYLKVTFEKNGGFVLPIFVFMPTYDA